MFSLGGWRNSRPKSGPHCLRDRDGVGVWFGLVFLFWRSPNPELRVVRPNEKAFFFFMQRAGSHHTTLTRHHHTHSNIILNCWSYNIVRYGVNFPFLFFLFPYY